MRLPGGERVSKQASSTHRISFSSQHTGDDLDLGNAVGVTENDTNLRGRGTLLGQLADLVDDLVGGGLEPGRRSARVRDGGGRNALALAVKSAHLVGEVRLSSCCCGGRLGGACRKGRDREFQFRKGLWVTGIFSLS